MRPAPLVKPVCPVSGVAWGLEGDLWGKGSIRVGRMGLCQWGPHTGFSWHGPPRDPRLLARGRCRWLW